jgi:hypothetical protein
MRWIWWILGLGAVGVGGYYLVSSATGKKISAKTACTTDLAEPYKTQATKAMAAGDAAAMTSLATQFDGKGWTCAATELRAAALKVKAATAGMADVPDPPRSAWQKLVDRSLGEADPGGDLVASLEAASADAGQSGYAKVRDLLRDAARDVRRTMRLARITEEPPAKAAQAVLAHTTDSKYVVTKATVDALDALGKQLDALGYTGAATEARAMSALAVEAMKPKTTESTMSPGTMEYAGTFSSILVTKPKEEMKPVDPFDALPADVRAKVDAAYASGLLGPIQDLSDPTTGALRVPVNYPEASLKAIADAKAIRARWTIAFLDLPLGAGSVFADIETSGDATLPSGTPSSYGLPPAKWPEVKPIADALFKRDYRTAANQLGHQYVSLNKLSPSSSFAGSIDLTYPLPT